MSYETGVPAGNSIDVVIDTHLKDFAVADGWTLNEDNYPDFLALSKGDCFVNIEREPDDVFNDDSGFPQTDAIIGYHLSSGYDGAGATPVIRYYSQPDDIMGSSTDNKCRTNDCANILNYWLFSDDSISDYIYLILETRGGHFSQMFFGNLDKKGVSYTGGGFAAGSFYQYYETNPAFQSRGSIFSTNYNSPPFETGAIDNTTMVYAGDASPSQTMRQDSIRSAIGISSISDTSSKKLSSSSSQFIRYSVGIQPSPYSGQTWMLPITCAIDRSDNSSKTIVLGEYPNIRYASMKGRADAEVETIDSVDWVFFPYRKTNPDFGLVENPPFGAIENSSYFCGFAIKKVV